MNPRGIIKFYGDISYPLYLCHIPLAWIVLYETTRHGISLHVGAALSIAVITFVSWILHIAIERPSQEWSKKLSISIPRKAAAAASQ
ncbi:Acyltransferase family protein [compost metagenome]